MQIIFNKKSYNSVEEMPANERQAYEQMFQIFKDENGNGIPDFLEGDVAKNVTTAFPNVVHYNGQMYNNLGELPPEARQKVQEAMSKLSQLGIVAAKPAAKEPAFDLAFQPSKPLIQQEPVIQESDGARWMLIVGFLAGLLVCAVAVAVFIFLR